VKASGRTGERAESCRRSIPKLSHIHPIVDPADGWELSHDGLRDLLEIERGDASVKDQSSILKLAA